MPKRLALSLLTLAAVITLLALLKHKDSLASNDKSTMSYQSFNRGDDGEAQQIMTYWRQDGERTSAVKDIVLLDFLLILIYVSYGLGCLIHRSKVEQTREKGPRRWLLLWLRAGLFFLVAGALIDVIQDAYIYHYVNSHDKVHSMLFYTIVKWPVLVLGVVAPVLISMITILTVSYVSGLLRTIWTFFPSMLFVFLTIFSFWIVGQGKDIMIAFTEGVTYNRRLVLFFLAIGFWVYVSWYSSRVIAHIKAKNNYIGGNFLDTYPRLAGNACFLVLELAVLQSPLLKNPLPGYLVWIIFITALVGLHFIDKWIERNPNLDTKKLSNRFWISFAIFFAILLTIAATPYSRGHYTLLVLLLIFHVVYLFYINLHHADTRDKAIAMVSQINAVPGNDPPTPPSPSALDRVMHYFCIDDSEGAYFKWFIRLSIVALLIDISAIWCLWFARAMGPFPLLILAFSVLLAFANVVTAFAVKYSVNFHLLLFLIALVIGLRETHTVRKIDLEDTGNAYQVRPTLETYLKAWLERVPTTDTSAFDVYFVLANGGASRSGFWTASVLGELEDASMVTSPGVQLDSNSRFSRHVFCLSGTSGGGVGVATFLSLLAEKDTIGTHSYRESAGAFLKQDYFSYTAARLLGPDFFNYIFHITGADRGVALESAFERYAPDTCYIDPHWKRPFSYFKAMAGNKIELPILFVNTTRMQDGTPGVVTNLRLDTAWFNQRIDVLGLLDSASDISMASGAILGARFPYVSPAGRIGTNYFVDGGYFDNSGAGVVQELMRGIVNLTDTSKDITLIRRMHRLRFRALHIQNSPIIVDSSDQKPVSPITNDLFAPVLTIVGAYGMQTTVNDLRLKHYIQDMHRNFGILAEYIPISLYKDSAEWRKDTLSNVFKKEPAYSMNWFMSDTTRHRIDIRLDSLIPTIKSKLK